jgi:hypothetical protein
MRISIGVAVALLLGVTLAAPAPADAKAKDPCKKAEAKLAKTGVGDADGDGISDCRELKFLGTLADDIDTDDDALDDGEEMEESCDPRNPDSDYDGIEDGDDQSPAIQQEVKAVLDALTCPVPGTPEVPGTPGSIGALGITATLDPVTTEFECKTCEELAALFALGEPVIVEIEIVEDVLGALTATEVKPKKNGRHRCECRDRDDDHDDDDDDDDDDEDDD